MISLYRVFPYLETVSLNEPGGPLYVPAQGGGRVDNPDSYSVLYLSDAAAGAIAESLGRFPEWPPAVLGGAPGLPGSVRAIARYEMRSVRPICHLDDPQQLIAFGLRPSDVVTRDYTRSRNWAQSIYETHQWAGVRWWSYYDAKWASFALWDTSALLHANVEILTLRHPALLEAGRTIVRRLVGG